MNDTAVERATRRAAIGPIPLLLSCVALVIAAIVAAEVMVVTNMRDGALRVARSNLGNVSVALAEQASRGLHGIDLVLSSLSEYVIAAGVIDSESYSRLMAGQEVHFRLSDKLTGLPYADAITMINAEGQLINFSRFWPPPNVNAKDRDYFIAMSGEPDLNRYVSEPVRNRATGSWTAYLARRVYTPDDSFAGLLLGAISLAYFEDFYRSVSLSGDRRITLARRDGPLLASYPPRTIDGPTPRESGEWIEVSRTLPDYPMVVTVSQSRASALQDWTAMVWMIAMVTAGCIALIILATVAALRWWHQQQVLDREQAERAEAERARAVAEADLARERERHAEEASRAKSGFLAMMSHEIRTPMNGVLGLAGTLLDENLAPQHRKVVEAIRDSGDSLLRILNDILDLSKLDAGRMTFEDVPFSPVTLAHGIVSILGPRARAKGLEMVVDCDPDLPAGLLGDAGRIRQVLLNIVSNAVKFTEGGSVTIAVSRSVSQGDRVTTEWMVRDTGIGIPPDRIDTLFSDFVQADSTIARRFGGTGLGLAISRRLIEQMGGSITVESEPGRGTIFRIHLTLPQAASPDEAERPEADITSDFVAFLGTLGRPLRVLFAEDNPTNQFVALQVLKGFNVQVDVAGDGLEAVDAATTFLYDVICMDMRMPEMDGITATRLIRKRGGRLASIPIIALTANAFPEDVRTCLAAGMNRFVPKPVQKDALIAAILATLVGDEPTPAATTPATADDAGPIPVDHRRLAELDALINAESVNEMLLVFDRETQQRLERLRNVLRERTLDEREMHTLKGAASTACAQALSETASRFEQILHAGGALTEADIREITRLFLNWREAVTDRVPEQSRQAA